MAESASDTVHVLVCDDEPDIRDMMSTYLQRRGYTVSMAESGAALDRAWDDWKDQNPRGSGNKRADQGDRNF